MTRDTAALPAYVGSVRVKGESVVWTMTPDDARMLAEVLEDGTAWDDLARRDADALRAAAEQIEPENPDD